MHTSRKPSGVLGTPKIPTTCSVSLARLAISFLLLAYGITPGKSQSLTLNGPVSLNQCVSTSITWEGGTGPFFLEILPPDSSLALQEYPNLISSPFIWAVNITSGTTVVFSLTDTTGESFVTKPVMVQPGGGDSCISGKPASSEPTVTSTAPVIVPSSDHPIVTSSALLTGSSNIPGASSPDSADPNVIFVS